MKINSNYVSNQPKFGKLNSIKTCANFDVVQHPKVLNVMKTFKDSDVFTQLCKNKDVDAEFFLFNFTSTKNPVAMMLLKIKELASKNKDNKLPVEIKLVSKGDSIFESDALDDLASQIKRTEYIDIERQYQVLKNKNGAKTLQNTIEETKFEAVVNSLLNR